LGGALVFNDAPGRPIIREGGRPPAGGGHKGGAALPCGARQEQPRRADL
jgi:hypothetical protein